MLLQWVKQSICHEWNGITKICFSRKSFYRMSITFSKTVFHEMANPEVMQKLSLKVYIEMNVPFYICFHINVEVSTVVFF